MEKKKPEMQVMKSTSQQLLRNPDIEPSSDVIAKALGESNNAYIKFISELASHDIHLEWRYYNDGKSWLAKGLFKWTDDIGFKGNGKSEILSYCFRLVFG